MNEENQEFLYVKMRPYNKQAGNLVRRFDWRIPKTEKFLTFTRAGVWHKVPFRFAEILKSARQTDRNLLSPPVFDVCTEEEARIFDSREKKAREEKRRIEEPTVDTALDMMESKPKSSSRNEALSDFNVQVTGVSNEDDDNEEEEEEPKIETVDFKKRIPDMSWTKNEIMTEARSRGIPVSSSDNKATLLQLLNK